jgi:hypothetical protein
MRRVPSYYCPAGIERPAHIVCRAPSRQNGPDGGQGDVYGFAFEDGQRWHKAGDSGWWCCVDGVAPYNTLRTDRLPGSVVVGQFLIPVLLALDGSCCIGYVAADGFRIPQKYQAVVARLQECLHYQGKLTEAHAALAVELIGINHHLSIHEIEAGEWLPVSLVWPIIEAACGITPSVLAQLEAAQNADK